MVLLVAKATTPTFGTNNKGFRRPSGHARGFTLVELLVALAIGAMLVAVAAPAFDKMRESAQYRDTVRALLSDLRLARSTAVSTGTEVAFLVDLGRRSFGVEAKPPTQFPASLQVRTTVAQASGSTADVASIRFLPSGGATGGSIDVLRPSGSGVRLQVDWFSGRVTQEAL